MKARLYGGAGHGRMVYLPVSTMAAPDKIAVPVLPPGQFEQLWALDPQLPSDTVVRYIDTGVDDDDGYRRYDWAPEMKEETMPIALSELPHLYAPSSDEADAMRTTPLCMICGRRSTDPIHTEKKEHV